MSDHLYETPTHPSAHLSSFTTKSLAAMNGEQSHKAKEFCRAFTNYSILQCDRDASSIYTSVLRCVAPPKSGEDAHVTHEIIGDLDGPTLNQPRLGFSYVF